MCLRKPNLSFSVPNLGSSDEIVKQVNNAVSHHFIKEYFMCQYHPLVMLYPKGPPFWWLRYGSGF